MMIQMNDLSIQYNLLRSEIEGNIQKVLDHGRYIMGPEVKALEEKLAAYVGVDYAITCSSGTDALLMTLMAWDIGPGDAVFTTPFTFIATSEVISLLRATPVFVDIDPVTYNMSPEALQVAIDRVIEEGTLQPKAILPVDLFGLPADYDKINHIATRYHMKVLEDGAQSFGSTYKGSRAGNLADAAATSFFPAKPLGCYGDGGAIFTNNKSLYEKLISIRVHGKGSHKYDNIRTGVNGRLDAIQAAVLLAKLTLFDEEVRRRNEVARRYTKALEDILVTPAIPRSVMSVWAQYALLAKDTEHRNQLMTALEAGGVKSVIYYAKPLHLQQVYDYLGYKEGDLPVAEDTARRIFSIPMHPYLTEEQINQITGILQES